MNTTHPRKSKTLGKKKQKTHSLDRLNPIESGLIWLSAADRDLLKKCPIWEKLKYEAFGASILVPVLFGMIAASYAVSTLTPNLYIIVGFSLIWGYIIMTVDRLLLATYRAYVPFSKKVTQFILRVSVALLMGLTVSHPLTLLLFKDTINSEIEKKRTGEMAKVRAAADTEKKNLEERITQATLNLQQQQKRYQDTVGGQFLDATNEPQATSAQVQQKDDQFSDIDDQIAEYKRERESVREELDRWQKVYDDEISGVRTGTPGIGPNARKIEAEELVWRREELKSLNDTINDLTTRRTDLAADLMARNAEANAQIEERRKELEKQKLEMFTQQQGQLLELVKGQIESASSELDRLRNDAKELSNNTRERIDSLKSEKRADMMTQTMVLHHLFEDPAGGGHFALAVYIVLIGLFTLVDTIPLVVKFFSPPGPYDYHQEHRERLMKEGTKNSSSEDGFRERMAAAFYESNGFRIEDYLADVYAKNLGVPDETSLDNSFLIRMQEQADICYRVLNYDPENPSALPGMVDHSQSLIFQDPLNQAGAAPAAPTPDSSEEEKQPKGIWNKLKPSLFSSKKPLNGKTAEDQADNPEVAPAQAPPSDETLKETRAVSEIVTAASTQETTDRPLNQIVAEHQKKPINGTSHPKSEAASATPAAPQNNVRPPSSVAETAAVPPVSEPATEDIVPIQNRIIPKRRSSTDQPNGKGEKPLNPLDNLKKGAVPLTMPGKRKAALPPRRESRTDLNPNPRAPRGNVEFAAFQPQQTQPQAQQPAPTTPQETKVPQPANLNGPAAAPPPTPQHDQIPNENDSNMSFADFMIKNQAPEAPSKGRRKGRPNDRLKPEPLSQEQNK